MQKIKLQKNITLKEESKIVEEKLQAQLKDLKEKQHTLGDGQGTWKAREQGLSGHIAYLQLEKCRLLQGLYQARSNYMTLQSSVNGLI